MKKIIALLFIAIALSSCEKDDICTEETTPRLVIEFFDVSHPSDTKKVINLEVKAVGQTNALGTFNNVSKIQLPLKIDGTSTQYSLILDKDGTGENEDFLQFDYTTQNVFVSRACGYKTIFQLNSPGGLTHTDATTPDGFWIQDTDIATNNINTENETHIKVYF